jgi:PTS system galactitol-specific IIA component
MQYAFIDLLNNEHILIGVEAADTQDAIGKLTAVLVETDHVTPEFADDVWEREKTFPTGLPTQPLAVAIPHADPDHVNQSAVCVGVLKSPVRFSQMGTDGSTVLDVPIIFLLAIKEKEKQVEMIQQLMALIQSPELLEGLSRVKSVSEAMGLIKRTLT